MGLLAAGLLDLMDEDRDDSASFPDFLRVSCLLPAPGRQPLVGWGKQPQAPEGHDTGSTAVGNQKTAYYQRPFVPALLPLPGVRRIHRSHNDRRAASQQAAAHGKPPGMTRGLPQEQPPGYLVHSTLDLWAKPCLAHLSLHYILSAVATCICILAS